MFLPNLRTVVAQFRSGGRSLHARNFFSIPNKEYKWKEAQEPVTPARLWLHRGIAVAGGYWLAFWTVNFDNDAAKVDELRQKGWLDYGSLTHEATSSHPEYLAELRATQKRLVKIQKEVDTVKADMAYFKDLIKIQNSEHQSQRPVNPS